MNSQFGHPIGIVHKKDGKLQMVVDYCTLNSQTFPDHHSKPYIDSILDSFYLAYYFGKLDLFSGYHKVCIEEGHQHKTASLLWWGLYEYTITPLGLTNASGTF